MKTRIILSALFVPGFLVAGNVNAGSLPDNDRQSPDGRKGVLQEVLPDDVPDAPAGEVRNLYPYQPADDSIRLDEVVVTGSRVPVSRDVMPMPVSVVSRTTIEQSGESSLVSVLSQQVPGLFVTTRGVEGYGVSTGAAGGITLRGFNGGVGQVLVLIDGHPQYAAIYGHPVADAYIAADAERVEVSHGAASVLYGSNAMGGAVNIITRKALHDGHRLGARLEGGSYGTQKYRLNDSYRNGRFSAFIGGGYNHTDGHRRNARFDSWNGFAKTAYELTGEWKITGNVNLTKFEAENPGTADRPLLEGVADVRRGMSGLSVENNYDKTRGAVNLYYNWGKHDINDGYADGETSQPYLFHSTDYMGGVNIYQAVNSFEGNTVTGGFDVKLYGGNAYRNPETEVYADHIKLHEIAGYLFVQQSFRRFMLNAGIRLEHHKLYGNEWVPQAGLSYKATAFTHLKFSVSKGFRTPNMRELYMYAPANAALLPERSLSYDFSVTQRLFENRLSAVLNLFHTKGDNIVQVVMVDGRPQNQNVGEFANKGVEFELNCHLLKNLHVNGNYAYLHMDTPITGAPCNKFYAGFTYTPGKFTIGGGLQLIDKLYLSTGENARTSNYTLLNTRVAYHPVKWAGLFVKGDNLLSRSYETMAGFPMPGATFTGGISLDF
jgi:iron complex outermembrane receptor protein